MSAAADLTNKVIQYIYERGGYAFRASSVGIYDEARGVYRTAPKKGVSDVLGCFRGVFLAVEVKIGKDRLRPEQEGFLANVRHAGGRATVVKDMDDLAAWWMAEFGSKFSTVGEI